MWAWLFVVTSFVVATVVTCVLVAPSGTARSWPAACQVTEPANREVLVPSRLRFSALVTGRPYSRLTLGAAALIAQGLEEWNDVDEGVYGEALLYVAEHYTAGGSVAAPTIPVLRSASALDRLLESHGCPA